MLFTKTSRIMNTNTITICGKELTLAYNFATEIAFQDMTETKATDFIREAAVNLQNQQRPDIKSSILLIIACAIAYYESKNEESPITDKDLMNEATPEEIMTALGIIIRLFASFYHIPLPEEKKKEGKGRSKKK